MPTKKTKKSQKTKSKTAKPSKKKASRKASRARQKRAPVRRANRLEFEGSRSSEASSTQSGDLEGLSRSEQADSESVDELVEEGNAFEAGIVEGVEEADDEDTREVHTREVPEDDVPEEYLDKD